MALSYHFFGSLYSNSISLGTSNWPVSSAVSLQIPLWSIPDLADILYHCMDRYL